jgi:hypothetical protein
MKNLKELIEKALYEEVDLNTKVRLKSKIKVDKPLRNVLPENWEKIRHIFPVWSGDGENTLIKQIAQSNELIDDNSKKFVSEDILEEFKKFVNAERELETERGKVKISDIEENDVITSKWEEIVRILNESSKIYGRDGDSCAFQSEDSLLFLQSIISGEFRRNTIEYQAGEIFELGE